MKKGLLASFMVALMLVTVLSAGLSANAVTVSKETTEVEEIEDGETTSHFTITVYDLDYMFYPNEFPVGLVKMTLTSEDGWINRVRYTHWYFGSCKFRGIPSDKNYIISAYKPQWRVVNIFWVYPDLVKVWMSYTGESKTIDNPFIERFPLLNLLLQRLRI
jgi:hypothetical protein